MSPPQPPPDHRHLPPPQGGGRGGGRGRTAAIVVGALTVVGAVIGAVIAFTGGDDDGGGGGKVASDGKKYRLITPATLLDDYRGPGNGRTITHPLGETDRKYSGMVKGTGVVNIYSTLDLASGEPDASEIRRATYLTFMGAYGGVPDPEKSVDTFFSVLESEPDDGKEMLGSPERVTPAGFDGGVMKCQLMEEDGAESSTGGGTPLCVWADSSTVGAVTLDDRTGGTSLSEAAETTAAVREEVRVPVG